MKLIQDNINDININDIIYLKESYVKNGRCVVAGLRNGRRIPLTMLDDGKECKNPIYELDQHYNGKLLDGFFIGDLYLFAVRKGDVNALYIEDTNDKYMVKVSAKFASPYFRDGVVLTCQPLTRRLNGIRAQIRAEYQARKEAEQGDNDGSSLL